jgi:hypothetical protein
MGSAGGPEGHLKTKGFYVYRGRRLIIAGSWLGLAEGAECLQRMSADAFAPALIDAGCRRAGLCVPIRRLMRQ